MDRNSQIYKLYTEGENQADIARFFSLSQGRVSQIISKMKSGGSFQWGGHRKRGLSESDLVLLEAYLAEGAEHFGFEGDLWTLARVRDLIADKFGVVYVLSWVREILRDLGYSLQKPIRKDYCQDAKQVSKWKEEDLPNLKKKPK